MFWLELYAELGITSITNTTNPNPQILKFKTTNDDIVKKWMDVILWIIADHILGTPTPFGLFANFCMKKSCIA